MTFAVVFSSHLFLVLDFPLLMRMVFDVDTIFHLKSFFFFQWSKPNINLKLKIFILVTFIFSYTTSLVMIVLNFYTIKYKIILFQNCIIHQPSWHTLNKMVLLNVNIVIF